MSRIGRRPIRIPKGTKVSVTESSVQVEGPKGKLSLSYSPEVQLQVTDTEIVVNRVTEDRKVKALHGLTRNLISNMLTGVSAGYQKQLEIQGVGFKAEVSGKVLNLSLGFSHPINFPIPDGITISVDRQTRIVVQGIDKQKVGQVAANIRRLREPDAYKGKGVRYVGEVVKLKAGKTGAK